MFLQFENSFTDRGRLQNYLKIWIESAKRGAPIRICEWAGAEQKDKMYRGHREISAHLQKLFPYNPTIGPSVNVRQWGGIR